MTDDIKDYVAVCAQCNEQMIEKPMKNPKVIISKGPLKRFIADLWQIPKKNFYANLIISGKSKEKKACNLSVTKGLRLFYYVHFYTLFHYAFNKALVYYQQF